jgi:hypothetical protein
MAARKKKAAAKAPGTSSSASPHEGVVKKVNERRFLRRPRQGVRDLLKAPRARFGNKRRR